MVAVLVEPPLPKSLDRPVELGAQAVDLAAADAVDAQGAHQGVDLAGGHAQHVSLGDDREPRPLAAPSRLEQSVGEVGAVAKLGALELDRARPGVPTAPAVLVTVPAALGRALVPFRPDPGGDFEFHQRLCHRREGLAQEVDVASLGRLPYLLEQCDSLRGNSVGPPSWLRHALEDHVMAIVAKDLGLHHSPGHHSRARCAASRRNLDCKLGRASCWIAGAELVLEVAGVGGRARVRRAWLSRRGQSLVEFALVLPVLLLLLAVTIDFGRIYLGWVNLQNVARIAANYAANNPADWNTSTYQDEINNDLQATNCTPASLPTPSFSSTAIGGTVSVTVTCTFHPITPIISNILGSGIPVSALSVFPVKSGIYSSGGTCNPPTALFWATPNTGTPGVTVKFDASPSTGNPSTFSWNFGDPSSASNTSTIEQPTHTYDAVGAYTVSLTVGNVCGTNTLTQASLIVVTNPTCTVPDFIALSTDEAPTLWQGAGFTGTINYQQGGLPWVIASQSLAAGQTAACTSTITLSKH